MQPTADRIHSVVQFIETVKPQIVHRVVPITDMFGPTITDPDLECIIVSAETMKGGQIVNQERQKKVICSSNCPLNSMVLVIVWYIFYGLSNVSLLTLLKSLVILYFHNLSYLLGKRNFPQMFSLFITKYIY